MLMPSIFGENLFDEFFGNRGERKNVLTGNSAIMKTDIWESDGGYELIVDLPGVTRENVKIELKKGYLTINAESVARQPENDSVRCVRCERFYGTCSRSFYVGEKLTRDDIKAKFENGVLRVIVPKKQPQPEVEEDHYITIE